jgi:hypothetical protein
VATGALVAVAVVVAVLVAVKLVVGVAAAATALDGPISTSNANEPTNHAVPATTASPPSFCTTGQLMRRD